MIQLMYCDILRHETSSHSHCMLSLHTKSLDSCRNIDKFCVIKVIHNYIGFFFALASNSHECHQN
jgi:hypothetical protein